MNHPVRVAVAGGVFLCIFTGWSAVGHLGAAIGFVLGIVLLVIPWHRQPLWSWVVLYIRRSRPITLAEIVTVTNDGAGGGVRYQDGFAISAVQILGKAHQPTFLTGATSNSTVNTLDVRRLVPLMRQSLGLTIDSLSIISAGSRRCATGDYPRVYDTVIGNSPYAGRRETWLVLRIDLLQNANALRWRATAGTAALAAAQRIAASLRTEGIRAKVATVTDIAEFEHRLGAAALEIGTGRWHSMRGHAGWMTTYAYRPSGIAPEALARAWSLRVDGVIQNITIFPGGTACATVTTCTGQPPTSSPSPALQTLPGQQSQALTNNLCGPRVDLRGMNRGSLPESLKIPIGPSGVLLGKTTIGDRMLQPLTDAGDISRVAIRAEDAITKRFIVRTAAAGERITLHTNDLERWKSVRMPTVMVTDQARPAPGTTVSVVDGSVSPAPRPSTIIYVETPGTVSPPPADVVIQQTGPNTVEVIAADAVHDVTVERLRAENRYAVSRHVDCSGAELQMAD